MAVTRPDFLSRSQWAQIQAMRFGLWVLLIQAVLVSGGSAAYITAVVVKDRHAARARALRSPHG